MKVQINNQSVFVSWKHLRNDKPNSTLCIIRNEKKEVLGNAIALCSPKDNFSKFIGRKVSLTKAVSKFPREVRTLFWTEFWKENKRK